MDRLPYPSGPNVSSTLEMNVPLDKYGQMDWKKMREMQLRHYSLEELEAEIARRSA